MLPSTFCDSDLLEEVPGQMEKLRQRDWPISGLPAEVKARSDSWEGLHEGDL